MKNNFLECCLLSSHISDYPCISQGKTRIPGVNDGEEFEVTDVSEIEMLLILAEILKLFIPKFYSYFLQLFKEKTIIIVSPFSSHRVIS